MNNLKSYFSRKSKLIVVLALAATGMVQTSCSDLWSEQHPETYYINSGETIADWLLNRSEEYSDFIYCLNNGKTKFWGEMRTYGGHTCFAPSNEAFDIYLEELFGEPGHTVEELTPGQCDTIAKTHLCNSTFFCNSLTPGQTFPYPNLLDRYLTYDIDSLLLDSARGSYKPIYKVNKFAEITMRDDTVQNGVVHKVNRIINPSNDFLPDVMVLDPNISYFYDALVATGLADSLSTWYMESEEEYPEPDYDSTLLCFQTIGKTAITYDTSYEKNEMAIIPNHRYFKFTLFVPTNRVFEQYGDTTLDLLRARAHGIYGDYDFVGEDGVTYNTFDTLSYEGNSLKKFLLYHMLPEELTYGGMNLLHKDITNNYKGWQYQDVEDFYETMLPHSIMRISTPFKEKAVRYINRKGIEDEPGFIKGYKVTDPQNIINWGNNGRYFYLDDYLLYNDYTKTTVFQTRMRYMCNTLSPDFINSNATGRFGGTDGNKTKDRYTVTFRKGKSKNFEVSDQSHFYVRYSDSAFGCYMGYEMTINGYFDVMVKLPPVPYEGTYEVRMFMNTMHGAPVGNRGVVQVYFREGNGDNDASTWEPCGIPVDLRIDASDARVGHKPDDDITKNITDDDAKKKAIEVNEKAMHNRGYVKAPDTYGTGSPWKALRNEAQCVTKILTTEFMRDNQDYWIRIRLVLDDPTSVCPFNFIELVPKEVYAGDEDSH